MLISYNSSSSFSAYKSFLSLISFCSTIYPASLSSAWPSAPDFAFFAFFFSSSMHIFWTPICFFLKLSRSIISCYRFGSSRSYLMKPWLISTLSGHFYPKITSNLQSLSLSFSILIFKLLIYSSC